MPWYCFQCTRCGHAFSRCLKVDGRNDGGSCPACHAGAADVRRDLTAEHVGSPNQDYDKPLVSEAMGVAPNQVEEHRRRFPDVRLTGDGRVVMHNHAERKRVMKTLGFHDKDGYG